MVVILKNGTEETTVQSAAKRHLSEGTGSGARGLKPQLQFTDDALKDKPAPLSSGLQHP
ncbi:hypothetical protein P7K49_022508, partial [Saguinus oedipus]